MYKLNDVIKYIYFIPFWVPTVIAQHKMERNFVGQIISWSRSFQNVSLNSKLIVFRRKYRAAEAVNTMSGTQLGIQMLSVNLFFPWNLKGNKPKQKYLRADKERKYLNFL